MKKQTFYSLLFTAILILFAMLTVSGQEKPTYIIKGDKLEKLEDPKTDKQPIKTSWTIEIKDTVYPVFKGTKGSYFILRTSKKTSKEYRQYLKIEEPKK